MAIRTGARKLDKTLFLMGSSKVSDIPDLERRRQRKYRG